MSIWFVVLLTMERFIRLRGCSANKMCSVAIEQRADNEAQRRYVTIFKAQVVIIAIVIIAVVVYVNISNIVGSATLKGRIE